MTNRRKIETVRVEILPPSDRDRRRDPADAAAALKKLVEKQVAEIMARCDDFLLRPFFDQNKISNELKRLQTVPEQRKWKLYFERFGCLLCDTRRTPHWACGMCQHCYRRTYSRLRTILRECERPSEKSQYDVLNQEKIARAALGIGTGTRSRRSLPRHESDSKR